MGGATLTCNPTVPTVHRLLLKELTKLELKALQCLQNNKTNIYTNHNSIDTYEHAAWPSLDFGPKLLEPLSPNL